RPPYLESHSVAMARMTSLSGSGARASPVAMARRSAGGVLAVKDLLLPSVYPITNATPATAKNASHTVDHTWVSRRPHTNGCAKTCAGGSSMRTCSAGCASAHAGEDVEAAPRKLAGGCGADASRSTGHHK